MADRRPQPQSPAASLARWRGSSLRGWLLLLACLLPCLTLLPAALGQTTAHELAEPAPLAAPDAPMPAIDLALPGGLLDSGPSDWTSPQGLSSTLQVMLLLTLISLAPAVMLMTTCFVRIIVVLGLLRQAIGTQQLPPSQVITSLSLFLSLVLMAPVWNRVYQDGVAPYTAEQITLEEAWARGTAPIRQFMSAQIDATGNSDTIWMLMEYMPDHPEPETYDDVPWQALLPAFMLSELKTAFLIGFQIYVPFLILDIVIASVTISMGMLMLPPVLISLPFKLLLFVLVDGWHLIVGMLLDSFAPFY